MIWSIVLAKNKARGFDTLTKQNIIFIILSGLATGLSWLFYFSALQAGKMLQVTPADKLSVAIAIVFSVVFLKGTVMLKVAMGVSLIIAGTIVMVWK